MVKKYIQIVRELLFLTQENAICTQCCKTKLNVYVRNGNLALWFCCMLSYVRKWRQLYIWTS